MINNNENPFVSIITSVFNCENYIVEAVVSALNQTYKNKEIIVIDDGSTDNTRNQLTPFMDQIQYIYQKNQGLSKSRNIGIRMARGDYISFLDADDRWHPDKIETQVNTFRVFPEVDMIFTDYSTIDGNGNYLEHFALEKNFPIFVEYNVRIFDLFPHCRHVHLQPTKNALIANFDGKIYFGNVFEKLFIGNFILPSTEIIRRNSIFPGNMFNESFKRAEDLDFHLRFSKHHNIGFLNISTTDYRINISDKMTANRHIPELIRNSIESKMSILRNDQEFYQNKKKFVKDVLSKDYARLSYFYLSDIIIKDARTCAIESIKQNKMQIKSYYILFLSMFPKRVLNYLRNFKRIVQHLRYTRSTRTI